MNIPTKKLKSGFEMPVFGLGTWRMGGSSMPNPFNNDKKDIAAIKAAIDLGLTHIDTAEIYAAGKAEKLVSEAIKGHDRSKLFLVSKAYAAHYSKADVVAACKKSLQRIQTDYLDLYLLHRYPGDGYLESALEGMNELLKNGLIKNIGISNFNLEHTKAAQQISKHPIVATQVHYNLIYREPEVTGLLNYCQSEEIILIAWRPVEYGALTKPGIPILDE